MGCSLEWRSPTNVFASALRSDWVPTNTIGTFLDCDRISGIHFSLKQTNMTDAALTAVLQFLPDVLEGGWHNNTKAKEEHISVGVDEGAEGVKVVLARCVAQLKGEWLPVHMHHRVICINRLRDANIFKFVFRSI